MIPERLVRLEGDPPRIVLRDGHRHLLRACFLERDAALDAWQSWRRMVPLDDADADSTRLLPLLYINLERHGVEDAAMAKYRGLLKYQWTENQRTLACLREASEALKAAEIDWIVLRGVALATVEPVPGAFRIGVPQIFPSDFPGAKVALAAAGFAPRGDASEGPWRAHLSSSKLGDVRLHASVLWNDLDGESDAALRDHAKTVTVDEVVCSVPAAGDLAVFTAAFGFHLPEFPRLNWLAELRVLLGHPEFIAWSELVSVARERRMLELVRAAVLFSREELGLEIPHDAAAELAEARPTFDEQRTMAGSDAGIGLRIAAKIERALRG